MGCSLKWEVLQVCCIEMQMRSNKLRMKSTHWPLVVYSPILKIHSPLARKTIIFCKAWSYPEKKHSSTCSITTSFWKELSPFQVPPRRVRLLGSTEPGFSGVFVATTINFFGQFEPHVRNRASSETWQIKITDTYLFKWNVSKHYWDQNTLLPTSSMGSAGNGPWNDPILLKGRCLKIDWIAEPQQTFQSSDCFEAFSRSDLQRKDLTEQYSLPSGPKI